MQKEILKKLKEMNYFKFVPSEKLSRAEESVLRDLKKGCLSVGSDRYDEEDILGSLDYRGYYADAEDLAEGGIGYFVETLKPILKQEGIEINSIENKSTGDVYDLVINGHTYNIYSEDNANDSWRLAPKRLMEIINTLLSESGSKERLYGRSGGNDQAVIFLTEEMYGYIRSLDLDKQTRPYASDDI